MSRPSCTLNTLSALSFCFSIIFNVAPNGFTSHNRLFSSNSSSNSEFILMKTNLYDDESCSRPWRGYLADSSHKSCKLENMSYFTVLDIIFKEIDHCVWVLWQMLTPGEKEKVTIITSARIKSSSLIAQTNTDSPSVERLPLYNIGKG